MNLQTLQNHIRTLVTLDLNEDLFISAYFNFEQGPINAHSLLDSKFQPLRTTLQIGQLSPLNEAHERIRQFLSEPHASNVKGLAVFARGGRSPFFLALPFRVAVPDWITVDKGPNIYHLVELKDNYHRYMLMICTEERVRLIEINIGEITTQILQERPDLRHRFGRGWSKEHYQNYRIEKTKQFYKEIIRSLDQRMTTGGYKHLILAGNPKVFRLIRENLPRHLASYLVDTFAVSDKEKTQDVVRLSLEAFLEEEQRESLSMVERVKYEIHRNGLVVVGSVRCVEALENNLVAAVVIAQEHAPYEKEKIARLAEVKHCHIEIVSQSDVLMRLGGVACLLRYRPIEWQNTLKAVA